MFPVISKTHFHLLYCDKIKSWHFVYIMNTLRQMKSALISIKQARPTHSAVFAKVPSSMDYNEAIDALNGLQSNFQTIQQIKLRIQKREECTNIKDIWRYLNRIGITPDVLKKLSVIHVAGTKGKGTTSALCESILNNHGYKTGFYSSPHLISVNERIRLNGQPMEKDLFADSFCHVYGELQKTQEFEGDMPKYFSFLTIMAFQVFLQQKVDVAIIEVGIGGRYDCTNVVNNVPVAGITSLGLEHTAILGNTIEEIAIEKGGILKPNCQAFTVHQPEPAMKILEEIADSVKCSLTITPEFDKYIWEKGTCPILSTNINMPTHKINISLAIQLAHSWMRHNKTKSKNTLLNNNGNELSSPNGYNDLSLNTKFNNDLNKNMPHTVNNGETNFPENICDNYFMEKIIPVQTCEGVNKCFWPGRCQVFRKYDIDFYIDGAHTLESIQVCSKWFAEHSRSTSKKYLIFNATGDRDSDALLKLLIPLNFKTAIFVPNITFDTAQCGDQINNMVSMKQQIDRCSLHVALWQQNNIKNTNKSTHNHENSESKELSFGSISAAINFIKEHSMNVSERPQVLITGSLHLVGNTLSILDPDFSESRRQLSSKVNF